MRGFQSFAVRRPGAVALALCAGFVSCLGAPPAMAQIVGVPRPPGTQTRVEEAPTVDLIQLTGKWETPVGPMVIRGGGPGAPNNRGLVTGHVVNAQGQEIHFGISVSGGKLRGQGFETNWDGLRQFDATVLADGTLEFRFHDQTYQGRRIIAGVRTGEPLLAASPFIGRWSTSLGELTLRAEGDHLQGVITPAAGSAEPRRAVALHAFENGKAITGLNGAWRSEGPGTAAAGALRIDLTEDKQRFVGSASTINWGAETEGAWTGKRIVAADPPPVSEPNQPAPTPPGPGPAQPVPQPGPTPPDPTPVAGFKPLRRLDVRVDRVQVARGYPTHQVHAFLTVRNTTPTPQYFTSGFITVFLGEADGVGQERSQPYRASVEPAALFESTPVIRPGGELKVRYVFAPGHEARLDHVRVTEGDKEASFAVQVMP